MPNKKLRGKKRVFYEAMIRTLGNVTASAKEVGCHVSLHYKWLESDPLYKEWMANIADRQVDFYENALNGLVKDKTPSAIIFALKCKGKNRGWVEKQEIHHSGEVPVNINVNIDGKSKELYDKSLKG